MTTIWLDGIPGGYHAEGCPCPGHCGNCYDDLAAIRAVGERMAAEGVIGPNGPVIPLHPLARYCSPYCRGRAKRDRALDRLFASRLQAATVTGKDN